MLLLMLEKMVRVLVVVFFLKMLLEHSLLASLLLFEATLLL